MTDDETLFHVRRGPLPWRESKLTECGLKAEKNLTISRDELIERAKKNGQRKTELVACQTCFQTTQRYWDSDASTKEDRETLWTLSREIQTQGRWGRPKGSLASELRALGILANRHREEFEELCADIVATVPLNAKQRAS